jgi:hypothetical protein
MTRKAKTGRERKQVRCDSERKKRNKINTHRRQRERGKKSEGRNSSKGLESTCFEKY